MNYKIILTLLLNLASSSWLNAETLEQLKANVNAALQNLSKTRSNSNAKALAQALLAYLKSNNPTDSHIRQLEQIVRQLGTQPTPQRRRPSTRQRLQQSAPDNHISQLLNSNPRPPADIASVDPQPVTPAAAVNSAPTAATAVVPTPARAGAAIVKAASVVGSGIVKVGSGIVKAASVVGSGIVDVIEIIYDKIDARRKANKAFFIERLGYKELYKQSIEIGLKIAQAALQAPGTALVPSAPGTALVPSAPGAPTINKGHQDAIAWQQEYFKYLLLQKFAANTTEFKTLANNIAIKTGDIFPDKIYISNLFKEGKKINEIKPVDEQIIDAVFIALGSDATYSQYSTERWKKTKARKEIKKKLESIPAKTFAQQIKSNISAWQRNYYSQRNYQHVFPWVHNAYIAELIRQEFEALLEPNQLAQLLQTMTNPAGYQSLSPEQVSGVITAWLADPELRKQIIKQIGQDKDHILKPLLDKAAAAPAPGAAGGTAPATSTPAPGA